MKKNKVCVIGVYFGKLPNYFDLWKKSAKNNTTVDFLLFTDQDVPIKAENITRIVMTLEEMQERATRVLGFEANLYRPYKACDYKPLYGLIFEDYVGEYQYWAHCDFDLIFGDLQAFFDAYELEKYDRFLALGHLSFYKNTPEVNFRYKENGATHSYREVFSSDLSYAFDEVPGMGKIYWENKFSFFDQNVFADISAKYRRYRIINTYRYDKKIKNYKHQIFAWEKGKVYRYYIENKELKREEKIYIHFKKRPNFELDFPAEECEKFYITSKGFVPMKGDPSLSIIKKLNPYPGFLIEFFEDFRFRANLKKKGFHRRIKEFFNKV